MGPSQPQGREDAIDTSESGSVPTRPALLGGSHGADLLFYLLFPQAGGKHYHPTCARCVRCHQMFTEGEEMYLTGKQI